MPPHPYSLSAVIVPPDGRILPTAVWDGWANLKAEQRLADGTSAKIDPERECRLAQMPSQLPQLPVPPTYALDGIESIRQRAHAKARAYIHSLRSAQGGAA